MKIERLNDRFYADKKRVVLQPFQMNNERTERILYRISKLSEEEVDNLFAGIKADFASRHSDFTNRLFSSYDNVSNFISNPHITENRKLLIGAYFSKEYSIESAALFNPSIVAHPDQSGLKKNELRFILSLRATGEGHISSVEFRDGIITANNDINISTVTRFASLPVHKVKIFTIDEIRKISGNESVLTELKEKLGDNFTYADVKKAYENGSININEENYELLLDYLDSNYDVSFNSKTTVSERVLFPYSHSECMGLEDVRLVKFINDDGTYKYYGTYTAYDGKSCRTQLIETKDFLNYEIRTMTGNGILDKGLALFPRKVNGMYYMISRQDGENLYIMKSNNLYHWENAEKLMIPEYDWEFVQIGNCGSPIETDKGWLLITHAVGSFRKYVISAVLLKIDEPEKVIGRCIKPILSPDEDEREGYVPNVVYSCGSIIKNEELILPYAMSDSASGFAKIKIDELLDELVK